MEGIGRKVAGFVHGLVSHRTYIKFTSVFKESSRKPSFTSGHFWGATSLLDILSFIIKKLQQNLFSKLGQVRLQFDLASCFASLLTVSG